MAKDGHYDLYIMGMHLRLEKNLTENNMLNLVFASHLHQMRESAERNYQRTLTVA